PRRVLRRAGPTLRAVRGPARRAASARELSGSMPVLPVPEPYDFAFSTERFRRFGPDLANLWHEGGLHRVVGGREVRIEPAPGGVLVEPLDDEIGAVVDTLLGLEFDLAAFEDFASGF